MQLYFKLFCVDNEFQVLTELETGKPTEEESIIDVSETLALSNFKAKFRRRPQSSHFTLKVEILKMSKMSEI
jgi:hypothetical protein